MTRRLWNSSPDDAKRRPRGHGHAAAAIMAALLLSTAAAGAATTVHAASLVRECPVMETGCAVPPYLTHPATVRAAVPAPVHMSPAITAEARPFGRQLQVPGSSQLLWEGLSLSISGHGFAPGKNVAFTVVDTSPSKVLFHGSVQALGAYTTVQCPGGEPFCQVRNPGAGT